MKHTFHTSQIKNKTNKIFVNNNFIISVINLVNIQLRIISVGTVCTSVFVNVYGPSQVIVNYARLRVYVLYTCTYILVMRK